MASRINYSTPTFPVHMISPAYPCQSIPKAPPMKRAWERNAKETLLYIFPAWKHHCFAVSNTYLEPFWTQGLQRRQASDAFPHASWSFSPVQFPSGARCGFCCLAPQAQLPKKLLLNPGPGVGCLDVVTSLPLGNRNVGSFLDKFSHGLGPKLLGANRPRPLNCSEKKKTHPSRKLCTPSGCVMHSRARTSLEEEISFSAWKPLNPGWRRRKPSSLWPSQEHDCWVLCRTQLVPKVLRLFIRVHWTAIL